MRALVYAEKYNKFLFGSDWPLAPVKPYIEFVKDLVPEEFYEDVFWKNAVSIFPRLKNSSGRVKFRIELRKLGTLSLLH